MSYILSSIIEKKIPFWNKRIFTEDDILKLCEMFGARHYEDDEMKGKGEYTIYKGICFVVINKKLKPIMKVWVGLHELGHHILHYPVPHKFSKGTKRKMDRQANFFAAVALIPTYLIKEKDLQGIPINAILGEIAEEYGYPKDLIIIRKEIYDHYQI